MKSQSTFQASYYALLPMRNSGEMLSPVDYLADQSGGIT